MLLSKGPTAMKFILPENDRPKNTIRILLEETIKCVYWDRQRLHARYQAFLLPLERIYPTYISFTLRSLFTRDGIHKTSLIRLINKFL